MSAHTRMGARVAHAAGWRIREARRWADRTVEIARCARAAHPGRTLALARHGVHLLRDRGFTLDEAFTLGLLDPDLGADRLDDQVSKRRLVREQARLNPNEIWYLTEDKGVFYRHAEALGLPVPRLYAILCESGPAWTHTGEILTSPDDWGRFLETGAPEEFVVKPARGYYGLGVRLVTRRGDRLEIAGRGPVGAAELCRELVADRQFHIFVVQERLRDHPDLPGDGRALQTLRIVTLVGRDSRVRILNAQFRLVMGDNVVDNFHNGATGNVIAVVDLADGTLGEILRTDERRVMRLDPPGSLPGTAPAGTRLPMWEEIQALVTDAARHFMPMRSIGWDVAITADGPVIVEANIWWDPPSPQPTAELILEALRTQ